MPADAERVVAVGFNDQHFSLALGVRPVGARRFQAGIDITGRPWAQDALGGRALGRSGAADAVVAGVEARFTRMRAQHPEFAGKRLVMAAAARSRYVYGPEDLRTRFFAALGFETPPAVQDLVGEGFGAPVSGERLDLLDQDVLVIYGDREQLARDPAFARLRVVREDRVIHLDADGDFANALGFSSPLRLPSRSTSRCRGSRPPSTATVRPASSRRASRGPARAAAR